MVQIASDSRMPSGHVALRVARLLRGGRDGVEADVGEEHDRGPAQDAAPAVLAVVPVVGWDEATARVLAGHHPVALLDVPDADDDEEQDDGELQGDDRVIDEGGLLDPDHQEDGDRRYDQHRRHVEGRARARPRVGVRVEGERRLGDGGRERQAEVAQKARHVAGPADRHRRRADRVFQD